MRLGSDCNSGQNPPVCRIRGRYWCGNFDWCCCSPELAASNASGAKFLSRIDSPFMGAGMPKAYSRDLRERVITAVETGASRREAAERFEVSVASAVKWLQRWYQQRSAAPKPRGGSVSPFERIGYRNQPAIENNFMGHVWPSGFRGAAITASRTPSLARSGVGSELTSVHVNKRIPPNNPELGALLSAHGQWPPSLAAAPAANGSGVRRCGASV